MIYLVLGTSVPSDLFAGHPAPMLSHSNSSLFLRLALSPEIPTTFN